MNADIKIPQIVLKSVFSFLFLGVTLILLFSFFSETLRVPNFLKQVLALTITPSVTTVSLPPPQNLSVTAVSSSQIDLTWDLVAGASYYNIYRDNNLVASSTVSSYSDTGLSPSTTYTYNVSAVDVSGMESPKSSSVSATTLSAPAPPPSEEGGGALPLIPPTPEVSEKSIVINKGATWTNSREVSLTISAKQAYQMAISNSIDFPGGIWEDYTTSKKWILTEGDGKKTVYAKFRSFSGGVSEIVSDSIILDTMPPANILNLEAIPGNQQILLKWEAPPDKDFAGVRIMGSLEFFPANPWDGILVYQGSKTSFLAVGLTNGKRYYYTVFSYDKAGNFSSGAIVSAVPLKEEIPPITPVPPIIPSTPIPSPFPPTSVAPIPSGIEELELSDFDFWQEGKKIIPQHNKVVIRNDLLLTISIDYEKVPEVLKTIMITLRKEDKSFSFLLRLNKQSTRYEATIVPPNKTGEMPFIIEVLDYRNQSFKKISGSFELIAPKEEIKKYKKIDLSFLVWLVVLLIILVLLTYYIWKKYISSGNFTL